MTDVLPSPHPNPLPKGARACLPSPFRRGAGGEVSRSAVMIHHLNFAKTLQCFRKITAHVSTPFDNRRTLSGVEVCNLVMRIN